MKDKLHRGLEIDAVWTERIGHWVDSSPARWLATALAHSGDSLLWFIAGVLLWRFGLGLWARIGERIVIVTALTWVSTTILKLFFQRPRPEGEQKLFYLDIDANSFPSGHAARVGGLVFSLGPLLPVWATFVLVFWALSVGLSRIALGLHYVSDVAAGFVTGAAAGLLLITW